MNNKEYWDKLRSVVDKGFSEYQKKAQEYEKLKKERDSGNYTAQYINSELVPEMGKKREELRKLQEEVKKEVRTITEDMKKSISDKERLNPEELTEDVKLLQGGLSLKERDIEGILERNSDNRTMIQLALRYAEEHGLKVNTLYVSGTEEVRQCDSIALAIDTVVKWYDTESAYRRIYDTVFSNED